MLHSDKHVFFKKRQPNNIFIKVAEFCIEEKYFWNNTTELKKENRNFAAIFVRHGEKFGGIRVLLGK